MDCKFLLRIMETFAKWRGPNGETFSNQFIAELQMGKLADAWKAEVLAGQTAQDQIQKLQSQQSYTTPGGYSPDAEDGAAIDALIAKHFSDFKPPPKVPVPTAGQP